jgi:DNA-binding winged helix-turn-helix (wHTH) protein
MTRRFGQHVIDTQTRTITCRGGRVALQRQPFELLQLLIDRAGQVVTREEIRTRLWADTVVEYDLSINYAIRQIRAALGTDAAFIQTVPRQGYQFTAAVTPHLGKRVDHLRGRRRRGLAIAAFASDSARACWSGMSRSVSSSTTTWSNLIAVRICDFPFRLIETHSSS